jgi:hypothetical protein
MLESNYRVKIVNNIFLKTENIFYLVCESEEPGKILETIII